MNMSHAPYLNWRRARTIDALEGTEFGGPAFTSGPMDGVDYDLPLAYPAADAAVPPVALALDPNPRVGDSDEYAGDTQGYYEDCAADVIATQAAVLSALGADVKVSPNFGDIGFAVLTDPSTLAIIANSQTFQVEVALRYDGGKLEVPNATLAIDRWTFFDTHCGAGKDVLAQGWIDHYPHTEEEVDQAIVGTAAFFLMCQQDRLYARLMLDDSPAPGEILAAEHNAYFTLAQDHLGAPTATVEEVTVVSSEISVFSREFQNGIVYIALQKIGTSGNDTVTIDLPEMKYSLNPNGTSTSGMVQFSLSVGDAVILLNGALMSLTIVTTPGASNANSYVTLSEADTFFFADPDFETWDRLATIDKYRHMIRATRELDRAMIVDEKYDTTTTLGVPNQALKIPRKIDTTNGTKFIPAPIKEACLEQILQNIKGTAAGFRADLQAQGVVEVELRDGTREKYGEGGSGSSSSLAIKASDILNANGFIQQSSDWA